MHSLLRSRVMGLAALIAMFPGAPAIAMRPSPYERLGLNPMMGPPEPKRYTPRSDRAPKQGSREAERRRRQSLDFSASERCFNRIRTQMGVN